MLRPAREGPENRELIRSGFNWKMLYVRRPDNEAIDSSYRLRLQCALKPCRYNQISFETKQPRNRIRGKRNVPVYRA